MGFFLKKMHRRSFRHWEKLSSKQILVSKSSFGFPVNIFLLKVNNRNTRKRCKRCSKWTIKSLERRQWRRFWTKNVSWVRTVRAPRSLEGGIAKLGTRQKQFAWQKFKHLKYKLWGNNKFYWIVSNMFQMKYFINTREHLVIPKDQNAIQTKYMVKRWKFCYVKFDDFILFQNCNGNT